MSHSDPLYRRASHLQSRREPLCKVQPGNLSFLLLFWNPAAQVSLRPRSLRGATGSSSGGCVSSTPFRQALPPSSVSWVHPGPQVRLHGRQAVGGSYQPQRQPHLHPQICDMSSPKQRSFAEGPELGTVLDYPGLAVINLVLRRRQIDWETLHCRLQRAPKEEEEEEDGAASQGMRASATVRTSCRHFWELPCRPGLQPRDAVLNL